VLNYGVAILQGRYEKHGHDAELEYLRQEVRGEDEDMLETVTAMRVA